MALLDEKGVSWAPLAKEMGIPPNDGSSAGRSMIRYPRHAKFLEAAARLAKDPLLGLRVGDVSLADHELLGQLIRHSATVRDALGALLEFQRLLGDGAVLDLEVEEGEASLWGAVVATDTGPCVQVHLAVVRRFLNMFAELVGTAFVPIRVLVGEVDPRHCEEIGRRLRAPVGRHESRTVITFSDLILDLPVIGRDARLASLLRSLCAREIELLKERSSPRARIAAATVECLETGSPTLERVAARLDITPSALLGQLNALGMGHREFVDNVRKGLAEDYLARSELSLTDIAQMLGYAELAAFNHAYRRWTGMSPRERRRYLEQPQQDPGALPAAGRRPIRRES